MEANWEKLYDRHAKALVLYARQWLSSLSDAEDAVQDAFVRLIKSPQQFGEDPVPVLYQAVRWAALDRIRREQRRQNREELKSQESPAETLFVDHLEKRERRQAVQKAMESLPDEQRQVLTMHIWGELGFREIGEALGISLNTAASRYRYGLKKLGQVLEANELTA